MLSERTTESCAEHATVLPLHTQSLDALHSAQATVVAGATPPTALHARKGHPHLPPEHGRPAYGLQARTCQMKEGLCNEQGLQVRPPPGGRREFIAGPGSGKLSLAGEVGKGGG